VQHEVVVLPEEILHLGVVNLLGVFVDEQVHVGPDQLRLQEAERVGQRVVAVLDDGVLGHHERRQRDQVHLLADLRLERLQHRVNLVRVHRRGLQRRTARAVLNQLPHVLVLRGVLLVQRADGLRVHRLQRLSVLSHSGRLLFVVAHDIHI